MRKAVASLRAAYDKSAFREVAPWEVRLGCTLVMYHVVNVFSERYRQLHELPIWMSSSLLI